MDLSKLKTLLNGADCVAHALTTKLPCTDGLYLCKVDEMDEISVSNWELIESIEQLTELGYYTSCSKLSDVLTTPQDNPDFTTTVLIRIENHHAYTTIGMGVHTINIIVDRRDNHIRFDPDILPSLTCWEQGNRVQQIIDILGTDDLLYQGNDYRDPNGYYCVYDYELL